MEFTRIEKKEYFESECRKIVEEIKNICTENKTTFFFSAAVRNDSTDTEYVNINNFSDIHLLLKDDHMIHHRKITEGYVAKPSREEIVLPLDDFLSGTFKEKKKKNKREKQEKYTNVDVPDNKTIKSLLKELKAACFLHGIPYFLTFVTSNDETKTDYFADGLLTGSNNIRLNTDQIKYHMMVMGGCVARTAREEVSLDLSDFLGFAEA